MRRFRGRLSAPALIVAVGALIVVAGGSAYAITELLPSPGAGMVVRARGSSAVTTKTNPAAVAHPLTSNSWTQGAR
jgi:hypothetical protein